MDSTFGMSRANTICYDGTNNVYYTAGTFTRLLVLNQNIMQQTMSSDYSYDGFIGRFIDNGSAEFKSAEYNPNSYQENKNSKFNMYPNPANNNITLSSSNYEEIYKIIITDLTGRIINNKDLELPSTEINVDISMLGVGTYIVNIVTSNNNYNLKLVIVR